MVSAFNVVTAGVLHEPAERDHRERPDDGAGELKTFTYIVLPRPSRASVIGLFLRRAYWNAFFSALLYLNDPNCGLHWCCAPT
jgi:multiple sugar transport system permease protein/putative aldouronate transport system permease protein